MRAELTICFPSCREPPECFFISQDLTSFGKLIKKQTKNPSEYWHLMCKHLFEAELLGEKVKFLGIKVLTDTKQHSPKTRLPAREMICHRAIQELPFFSSYSVWQSELSPLFCKRAYSPLTRSNAAPAGWPLPADCKTDEAEEGEYLPTVQCIPREMTFSRTTSVKN